MGVCGSYLRASFTGVRRINGAAGGWSPSSSSAASAEENLQADDASFAPEIQVPPVFAEILKELGKLEQQLGGVRNFRGRPRITQKVKATDFRRSYTDFEYVYLTVLGLSQLQVHGEEIIRLNNGRMFKENPGTQMLERVTGITMHAEREGANHLLRSAPSILLRAFAAAQGDRGGMRRFFQEAFDRLADPCLEGRVGRLLEYLATTVAAGGADAPRPQDLALQTLPATAGAEEIVGEHLRVFVNECTWNWARERGIGYSVAVADRDDGDLAFMELCNAETFKAAVIAKGEVKDVALGQWEVELESKAWSAYGREPNQLVEQARLLGLGSCQVKIHAYLYEIDLTLMVQRNLQSGKERPIRWLPQAAGASRGRITQGDLTAAVARFVDLATLAPAPIAPPLSELQAPQGDVVANGPGSVPLEHNIDSV